MLSCQLDFFLDYVEILRKFEVEKVDEKFEKFGLYVTAPFPNRYMVHQSSSLCS